jgi:hypothetical protein
MQRITPHKSWLLKAVFFGVYFVFFAVQLHFRYACQPFQDTVYHVTSVSNQTDKKPTSLEQSTQQGSNAKPESKLNKRYFPQPVQEAIALQFDLDYEVLVVPQKQVLALTPSLPSSLSTSLLLRGPPVS